MESKGPKRELGGHHEDSVILPAEVTRSLRDVQPGDYLFKIESFSILLESDVEKYESNDFEAGGYKWRLSLYPNGNKKKNVKDHISLYLVIADTAKLPRGWEVNVNFKLFVFDHLHDKYLTIQDAGQVRRFHAMNTDWGFDQFLSLDIFKNPSNGYLVDDCCVFGAEVFVINYAGKGECLSMKKELYNNIYTWRVVKFSSLSKECLYSDEFKLNEWTWYLELFAKGDEQSDGQSLSLYLAVAECEKLPPNWKLYIKYKLRVKDQVNSRHYEREAHCCFHASDYSWGFKNFMFLSNLNDLSKGFLLNDSIMVEAEILALSVIKNFT
ncbi:MATH domain and coiled-coil domain-containing protein At2g01790-like [Cornus florida]|uniref:MATH domain and coiled-coil domain-containing protein At2g01790-like n=1 Tax=Cornus florida TaxID=4283 RepID=UPI00289A531D|nr:MATH domain and coiled-coil domain-containing protein At2g01790-like [Cornus florida]